jgi:uncharacterized membrane protein YphA (DoxX/SURF4 family)
MKRWELPGTVTLVGASVVLVVVVLVVVLAGKVLVGTELVGGRWRRTVELVASLLVAGEQAARNATAASSGPARSASRRRRGI